VCLLSEGLKWRDLNLVDWDMFEYRFLASTCCRANAMRWPTLEPYVSLKVLELSRHLPERIN
jgi:hypothetical protein